MVLQILPIALSLTNVRYIENTRKFRGTYGQHLVETTLLIVLVMLLSVSDAKIYIGSANATNAATDPGADNAGWDHSKLKMY